MASRQNRKKKGRANQQNRERTVTTLTEGPNPQFLVPTPSEEPAGANMSSPFSVSSSSGAGPNSSIPNGGYQNFAYSGPPYSNNYMGPTQLGGNIQQSQFYPQQPSLPPGRDDLEILENLKAQIKSGQHNRFKATAQPQALLAVYHEGLQSEAHYVQQGVTDYQGAGFNQMDYDVGSATSDTGTKTALSTDASRRLPRIQTKDDGDPSGARRSIHSSPVSGPKAINKSNSLSQTGNRYGAHNTNNTAPSPSSKPANDARSFPDSKASANGSAGSDTAQPLHSRFGSNTLEQRGQEPDNQKVDQRRPPGDSPVAGEYGSRARALSDVSAGKPLYDSKGDVRASRDLAWQQRDGPTVQDDKRGRLEPDRPGPPSGRPNGNLDSRPNIDARPNGNEADARGALPRDQRPFDRDRHRDRDRDRDRERDWDRDRDRDRRPDFRRDARGLTDARRPPPELRHYEPQYPSDLPRRNDNRPPADDAIDIDKRPPPTVARPVPIDDRVPRAPPLDRSARIPPIDDRHPRPPSGDNRRAPSPENRNLRPAPPSQSMQDVPPRLGAVDRNAVRGPLLPVDDHTARPLEDQISRGPPSLQERITHPPASRADDRLTRQPSLEERLSRPPAAGNDRSIPHDDRVVRPSTADRTARPVEPIRPPVQEERMGRPDDRSVRPGPPNDRYVRPVTPPQDRVLPREGGYTAVPRSSSVRDDSRVLRPPSPLLARDYRPARALSRDRDLRPAHRSEVDRPYDAERRPDRDLRPAHRSEVDRPYDAERRPDLMDVDPPARFNDRPPYSRHLTPPPATDRVRSVYPPPSPPRADSAYVDPDRRYPVGDRRDYPYDGRQRQTNGLEDESYWKSRPGWDREILDKDRIERSAPPARNNGWETREESERRNSFPGSPPTRSFDTSQQRPLGSRLAESYARPGEDRQYPPRDHERPRYPPTSAEGTPAFSRVRPRSPSPMSRRPGPGSVVDDGRPPMKRAREDVPYTSYYSPEPRRPAVAGGPSDYPPRTAPTPRPEGAPYYDGRAPPPGPSGGGRSGPPYDRDYPTRDRASDIGGYVPGPSYPPRSPPPSRLPPAAYGGRGNFTRGGGGDSRDDRQYSNNMPPPPPRSS